MNRFSVSVSLWLVALSAPAAIRFAEITPATGIDFRHENSPTSRKYLVETMGGGVALFDFDGDGHLDIFFTNGAEISDPMPAGQMPEKSDPKFADRLYRNNGDGRFTDVTEQAGVSGRRQGRYGMGAAVGDYDNDGDLDLYVTNFGRNILYRNNGDSTFSDVTEAAGVAGGGWSTSAGFFDYDRDGNLDLFVCRYLSWSFENDIYCGEKQPGYRAYCHPDQFPGLANILYRNNGDGTFTDVSESSGIAAAIGKALGVAFADYDSDGWVDIYVANDSVRSFLFRNSGDGTFREVSLEAGAGLSEDGQSFAGMGVDFADYDNDGHPDLFITDLANEKYVLYHNRGDGTFDYVTNTTAVGEITRLSSGWGVKFVDFDNDGWKDLFVAQGHVLDTIELTQKHLRYRQPPLILRNERGNFADASRTAGAAFSRAWAGRGAAFGDLDNDGDTDVVVSNLGEKAYILRNETGSQNHWLAINLEGKNSNREGIGARIEVKTPDGPTRHYTVSRASSYLSSSDAQIPIGLGNQPRVDGLTIQWPSGKVKKLGSVPANQQLTIPE